MSERVCARDTVGKGWGDLEGREGDGTRFLFPGTQKTLVSRLPWA